MRVSIIPLIVRKLRRALAIVQDTNTATRNIDVGKFVMWKGELCKALSAITTGDTLSSTNLEACTDGGLNALNSNIDTLFTSYTQLDVNSDLKQYKMIVAFAIDGSVGMQGLVTYPSILFTLVPSGRLNVWPTAINSATPSGYGYAIYTNGIITNIYGISIYGLE